MTAKWVLFKTVQREPGNKLACYALADLLEEEGHLDLSFAYRWMVWHDRQCPPFSARLALSGSGAGRLIVV